MERIFLGAAISHDLISKSVQLSLGYLVTSETNWQYLRLAVNRFIVVTVAVIRACFHGEAHTISMETIKG